MTSEVYGELIDVILREIHKSYCGEDDTIVSLLISITTRLVENSNHASRNIVLSEMSGAGKDALVKTLCNIILEPEVTYFHRSKLSPEIFTYWHTNEDDWTWDGKVIHIEDPQPDLMNSQGFKTMASGEKSATVVKDQKASELAIKGKPNLVITTYQGCVDVEGVRRYPFIHLDTSSELTEKVKILIANRYSNGNDVIDNKELCDKLRRLKPYTVRIPYANDLVRYFPSDLVIRTYFQRFLDYVASCTVLHQEYRELDDDGNLLSDVFDYEVGRLAFLKTITNSAMIPLNRDQEELLRIIAEAERPLFASEIHTKIARNRDWIYRNLEILKRYKLIEQNSMWKEDANKEVTTFGYLPNSLVFLLPSTGRLSGCRGCRGVKEEDRDRYDIVSHFSDNQENLDNPSRRPIRQPTHNHTTTKLGNHVTEDNWNDWIKSVMKK